MLTEIKPEYGVSLRKDSPSKNGNDFNISLGSYNKNPHFEGRRMTHDEYLQKKKEKKLKFNLEESMLDIPR